MTQNSNNIYFEGYSLIDILQLNRYSRDFEHILITRNYRWDKHITNVLLNDLTKVISNNFEKHYCGSVILSASHNNKNEECIVVDGQQRLLAVSIFIRVLYNEILKTGKLLYANDRNTDTSRLKYIAPNKLGITNSDDVKIYTHLKNFIPDLSNRIRITSQEDQEVYPNLELIADNLETSKTAQQYANNSLVQCYLTAKSYLQDYANSAAQLVTARLKKDGEYSDRDIIIQAQFIRIRVYLNYYKALLATIVNTTIFNSDNNFRQVNDIHLKGKDPSDIEHLFNVMLNAVSSDTLPVFLAGLYRIEDLVGGIDIVRKNTSSLQSDEELSQFFQLALQTFLVGNNLQDLTNNLSFQQKVKELLRILRSRIISNLDYYIEKYDIEGDGKKGDATGRKSEQNQDPYYLGMIYNKIKDQSTNIESIVANRSGLHKLNIESIPYNEEIFKKLLINEIGADNRDLIDTSFECEMYLMIQIAIMYALAYNLIRFVENHKEYETEFYQQHPELVDALISYKQLNIKAPQKYVLYLTKQVLNQEINAIEFTQCLNLLNNYISRYLITKNTIGNLYHICNTLLQWNIYRPLALEFFLAEAINPSDAMPSDVAYIKPMLALNIYNESFNEMFANNIVDLEQLREIQEEILTHLSPLLLEDNPELALAQDVTLLTTIQDKILKYAFKVCNSLVVYEFNELHNLNREAFSAIYLINLTRKLQKHYAVNTQLNYKLDFTTISILNGITDIDRNRISSTVDSIKQKSQYMQELMAEYFPNDKSESDIFVRKYKDLSNRLPQLQQDYLKQMLAPMPETVESLHFGFRVVGNDVAGQTSVSNRSITSPSTTDSNASGNIATPSETNAHPSTPNVNASTSANRLSASSTTANPLAQSSTTTNAITAASITSGVATTIAEDSANNVTGNKSQAVATDTTSLGSLSDNDAISKPSIIESSSATTITASKDSASAIATHHSTTHHSATSDNFGTTVASNAADDIQPINQASTQTNSQASTQAEIVNATASHESLTDTTVLPTTAAIAGVTQGAARVIQGAVTQTIQELAPEHAQQQTTATAQGTASLNDVVATTQQESITQQTITAATTDKESVITSQANQTTVAIASQDTSALKSETEQQTSVTTKLNANGATLDSQAENLITASLATTVDQATLTAIEPVTQAIPVTLVDTLDSTKQRVASLREIPSDAEIVPDLGKHVNFELAGINTYQNERERDLDSNTQVLGATAPAVAMLQNNLVADLENQEQLGYELTGSSDLPEADFQLINSVTLAPANADDEFISFKDLLRAEQLAQELTPNSNRSANDSNLVANNNDYSFNYEPTDYSDNLDLQGDAQDDLGYQDDQDYQDDQLDATDAEIDADAFTASSDFEEEDVAEQFDQYNRLEDAADSDKDADFEDAQYFEDTQDFASYEDSESTAEAEYLDESEYQADSQASDCSVDSEDSKDSENFKAYQASQAFNEFDGHYDSDFDAESTDGFDGENSGDSEYADSEYLDDLEATNYEYLSPVFSSDSDEDDDYSEYLDYEQLLALEQETTDDDTDATTQAETVREDQQETLEQNHEQELNQELDQELNSELDHELDQKLDHDHNNAVAQQLSRDQINSQVKQVKHTKTTADIDENQVTDAITSDDPLDYKISYRSITESATSLTEHNDAQSGQLASQIIHEAKNSPAKSRRSTIQRATTAASDLTLQSNALETAATPSKSQEKLLDALTTTSPAVTSPKGKFSFTKQGFTTANKFSTLLKPNVQEFQELIEQLELEATSSIKEATKLVNQEVEPLLREAREKALERLNSETEETTQQQPPHSNQSLHQAKLNHNALLDADEIDEVNEIDNINGVDGIDEVDKINDINDINKVDAINKADEADVNEQILEAEEDTSIDAIDAVEQEVSVDESNTTDATSAKAVDRSNTQANISSSLTNDGDGSSETADIISTRDTADGITSDDVTDASAATDSNPTMPDQSNIESTPEAPLNEPALASQQQSVATSQRELATLTLSDLDLTIDTTLATNLATFSATHHPSIHSQTSTLASASHSDHADIAIANDSNLAANNLVDSSATMYVTDVDEVTDEVDAVDAVDQDHLVGVADQDDVVGVEGQVDVVNVTDAVAQVTQVTQVAKTEQQLQSLENAPSTTVATVVEQSVNLNADQQLSQSVEQQVEHQVEHQTEQQGVQQVDQQVEQQTDQQVYDKLTTTQEITPESVTPATATTDLFEQLLAQELADKSKFAEVANPEAFIENDVLLAALARKDQATKPVSNFISLNSDVVTSEFAATMAPPVATNKVDTDLIRSSLANDIVSELATLAQGVANTNQESDATLATPLDQLASNHDIDEEKLSYLEQDSVLNLFLEEQLATQHDIMRMQEEEALRREQEEKLKNVSLENPLGSTILLDLNELAALDSMPVSPSSKTSVNATPTVTQLELPTTKATVQPQAVQRSTPKIVTNLNKGDITNAGYDAELDELNRIRAQAEAEMQALLQAQAKLEEELALIEAQEAENRRLAQELEELKKLSGQQ